MSDIFEGWTDSQLRDYLVENGAHARPGATRAELVDLCGRVGRDVESRVLSVPSFTTPLSTTPLTAPPAGLQWNAQVPPAMPPAGGPKKKALICGINYFGTSMQLRGCINDARCMHYFLTQRFGFREENILFMTDDHPDPWRRPTRYNMMNGFTWLMTGLKPGDSLVFHYSGHGSQQRDFSGVEADGLNETLCPLDFRYAGEIIDDELNHILVRPLTQGVKLHAIIDACHSGSVMDLPYMATCHSGYLRWESENNPWRPAPYQGTSGGFCVQFGASRDSQVAADTSKLSGGVATGAATFSFIQAIERRGLRISYGALLVEMYNTLQMAGLGPGGGGVTSMDSFLLGILGGGAGYRGQEPVLSANYAFDLNFILDI